MILLLKIIHFLSLAIAFGLTTANLLIFRYTRDGDAGEAQTFWPLQRQFSAVGLIAIILLWITGIALYLLVWLGEPVSAWFWVKMLFVAALTGLAITARKMTSAALAEGKSPPPATLRQLAHGIAIAAVGAIVSAVLAFNA
jgi:uncharacterized membrane protein